MSIEYYSHSFEVESIDRVCKIFERVLAWSVQQHKIFLLSSPLHVAVASLSENIDNNYQNIDRFDSQI